MVNRQLSTLLPTPIFEALENTAVFDGSLSTFAVWVMLSVLFIGIFGVAYISRSRASGVVPNSARVIAVVAAILTTTVGVVAVVSADSTFSEFFHRAGLFFVAVVTVGYVVVVIVALRRRGAIIALVVLGSLGAFSAALYAVRFPVPLTHAYYLYWDRYLYAAALPAAAVLVVVAASALTQSERTKPRKSWQATGVVWLVIVVAIVAGWPQVAATRTHWMFRDASSVFDAISDEVGILDNTESLYAGGDLPAGWFFPNTFRAIGLPLDQTFGVDFANLPSDPFGADPTLESVLALARTTPDPLTIVWVEACSEVCSEKGAGLESDDDGTWVYRYSVPVNSGMQPLSTWAVPWLAIRVFSSDSDATNRP